MRAGFSWPALFFETWRRSGGSSGAVVKRQQRCVATIQQLQAKPHGIAGGASGVAGVSSDDTTTGCVLCVLYGTT